MKQDAALPAAESADWDLHHDAKSPLVVTPFLSPRRLLTEAFIKANLLQPSTNSPSLLTLLLLHFTTVAVAGELCWPGKIGCIAALFTTKTRVNECIYVNEWLSNNCHRHKVGTSRRSSTAPCNFSQVCVTMLLARSMKSPRLENISGQFTFHPRLILEEWGVGVGTEW